jgi:predicted nucleotide-binding protein
VNKTVRGHVAERGYEEAGPLDPKRAGDELRSLYAQAGRPEVLRDGPEHKAWKAKVAAVMESSLGKDSDTLREFKEQRYYIGVYSGAPGEAQRDAEYFADRVRDAAGLIEAAIYQLDLQSDPGEGESMTAQTKDPNGPIFVVHGHNDARKYELMRLLDRAATPEAIVLHEQANRGQTILEKFEHHAQTASFAVVLLTGDDEGRLRGSASDMAPRGRQNVIFELGVFIGALGRSNVAVLMDDGVEKPSDISGLVYISLDAAGAWRHSLLKELQAAGVEVDFNRIP